MPIALVILMFTSSMFELTVYFEHSIKARKNPFKVDTILHSIVEEQKELFYACEKTITRKFIGAYLIDTVLLMYTLVVSLAALSPGVRKVSQRIFSRLNILLWGKLESSWFLVLASLLTFFLHNSATRLTAALLFIVCLVFTGLFYERRRVRMVKGAKIFVCFLLFMVVYDLVTFSTLSTVGIPSISSKLDPGTLPDEIRSIISETGFSDRIYLWLIPGFRFHYAYYAGATPFTRRVLYLSNPNFMQEIGLENFCAIIAHEIGHSFDNFLAVLTILENILGIVAVEAATTFLKAFAKRVTPGNTRVAKVLLFLNCGFILAVCETISNTFRRRSEFIADRYAFSVLNTEKYDIRKAIYRLTYINRNTPLWLPDTQIFSARTSTHPSVHRRIQALDPSCR